MLAPYREKPRTAATVQGSVGDLAWRLDLPNRYSDTGNSTTREEADFYFGIIARLNVRWRVITCKHGIQFILQRCREVGGSREPRWVGISYCQTTEALRRCVREHARPVNAAARDVL